MIQAIVVLRGWAHNIWIGVIFAAHYYSTCVARALPRQFDEYRMLHFRTGYWF